MTEIQVPPWCRLHSTYSIIYLENDYTSSECQNFARDISLLNIFPQAHISRCAHLAVFLKNFILGHPIAMQIETTAVYIYPYPDGASDIYWLKLTYDEKQNSWSIREYNVY